MTGPLLGMWSSVISSLLVMDGVVSEHLCWTKCYSITLLQYCYSVTVPLLGMGGVV